MGAKVTFLCMQKSDNTLIVFVLMGDKIRNWCCENEG